MVTMFSNNNHARARKTRHARKIDLETPALPPRRQNEVQYNDLQAYAYDAGYQASQAFFEIPPTPPPAYDDYFDIMPNATFYQQPEQYVVPGLPPRDGRVGKNTAGWVSTTDLRQECGDTTRGRRNDCPIVSTMVQGAALCDRAAAAFQDALSRLDREEEDEEYDDLVEGTRGISLGNDQLKKLRSGSIIDFRKTWMYANSRLPPHMPPMKIYLPTWQIISYAARASMDVYRRPRKNEKQTYIDADWRAGTKAMVIQSSAVDDKNLIVIAIRGSKWNIVDWAVNFHPAPSEPVGFFDDEGNACHAGFLRVARAMISPIAARLRDLLQQDPSRASSSLLFTGHSAGGAVASLLYMHMMAVTVESKLNILTGCFKRVHCVTFGTPPLTLLPLQNPTGKRSERNVFMTFANEGDPVVRADRQYLSTLTRIIAAPSPKSSSNGPQGLRQRISGQTLNTNRPIPLKWDVPPATLSNPGRMVLLREQPFGKRRAIEAVQVTDEELRDVIFGDPDMHQMKLYQQRVCDLAYAAVTGTGAG